MVLSVHESRLPLNDPLFTFEDIDIERCETVRIGLWLFWAIRRPYSLDIPFIYRLCNVFYDCFLDTFLNGNFLAIKYSQN